MESGQPLAPLATVYDESFVQKLYLSILTALAEENRLELPVESPATKTFLIELHISWYSFFFAGGTSSE